MTGMQTATRHLQNNDNLRESSWNWEQACEWAAQMTGNEGTFQSIWWLDRKKAGSRGRIAKINRC